MITVAKTAGFCFGVNRGVEIVYNLVDEGNQVCTLGPIIHNPQVVNDLAKRGVRIINSPEEAKLDETLVIRSHGVRPEVYDYIKNVRINFKDATCPFVKKIHNIVKRESTKGKIVLIAGNRDHPEVDGIKGYCEQDVYVFSTLEELKTLFKNHKNFVKSALILVAQTTFNSILWRKCVDFVNKLCTNIKIFDTICNATSVRQKEAISLANNSDLLIVVGGKCSSNTRKLFDLCSARCKSMLIENVSELHDCVLTPLPLKIGITAGASTPAYIIEEVHEVMSNKINESAGSSGEMSFAELFEQSGQQAVYKVGKKVKGVVTAISKNEVQVDIGGKQAGVIPVSEISADSSVKVEDVLKKGDEVDLIVTKVSDQDGIVTLSKKRYDAEKGYDMILEAMDQDKVLNGTITDSVRGGVLAVTCGVKVFIPISQLSDHRIEDTTEFVGKNVDFKIIDVTPSKRRAVASVRKLLNELKQVEVEKLWNEIKEGDIRTGTVKSITNYGVFVDLGGVDGMIHITELSWVKVKHPSDIVSIGDTVEVTVKDLDRENNRISLSYRKAEDDPWRIFTDKYSVGQVLDVKVFAIKQFGAFVGIMPGVDGLIHISQISNKRIDKISDVLSVGDVVKAQITDIDYDAKRVSLSMKTLLENSANEEQQKNLESVENIEGVEINSDAAL